MVFSQSEDIIVGYFGVSKHGCLSLFYPVMCWRPVTAGTGFSPPVVKKTDGLMDSNQLNKMSY